MELDKCYCFNCRKRVNYIIIDKEITSIYNGITILYDGKACKCIDCGGMVSKRAITNENVRLGNKKIVEELAIRALSKMDDK